MDGQQRVAGVVRPAQHGAELERREPALERGSFPGELFLQRFVRLGLHQLGHLERGTNPRRKLLVRRDPPLQLLQFLHHGPGAILVGPEGRVYLLRLEIGDATPPGIQVKENLEVRGGGPGARLDDLTGLTWSGQLR